MDIIRQLSRLLDPLRLRIRGMIGRAIVNLVDDSTKLQLIQATIGKDEIKSRIERLQNFGFTSKPVQGAEAVVLFIGGNKDSGVVIAIDDSRHRVTGLPNGASCQYDTAGNVIKCLPGSRIEIIATDNEVRINAGQTINLGNANLTALIKEEFKSIFDQHVHNVSTAGGPAAQTGVTSSPVKAPPGSPPGSTILIPATPGAALLFGDAIPSTAITTKAKAE